MEELLKEIKGYALSNEDINDILEPDTKVFPYPNFANMNHIDEAFDPLGRCIILFLTQSETNGHWVCMFKRDKKTIEYFDSYGEKPEGPRSWLSQEQLDRLGQSEPYLLDLLRKSGYRVYYNTYPYQSDKNDINTCGRWTVARLICKDLSNKEFYNAVKQDMKDKNIKSFDDWVALFTYDILGK
jgi:hypothetical protein